METDFTRTEASLRSYAKIDLVQIEKNYLVYKEAVKNNRIMAVVKANAYGHGAVEVARRLELLGVSDFAVATLEEALALRRAGVCGEILVLGYTSPEMAETIYEYNITQTLLSESYASALSKATDKRIKCHAAINTGMNRIGLDGSKPSVASTQIRDFWHRFELTGIYTHLSCAASGEKDDERFTLGQLERFSQVVRETRDLKLKTVHALNSAGGLLYSDYLSAQTNTVRLGIILYGLKPEQSFSLPLGIAPALSWRCRLTHIFSVERGERIGYGDGFVAKEKMRIGVLSCGYADGYKRCLSNHANVIIKGKYAKIIGNICMDQMMVDLTEIEAVEGEAATLIGKDGDCEITADELGELANTIGYEVVVSISERTVKKYTK